MTAITLAAACGGNVVVDKNGTTTSEGGGGTGGTGGAGGTGSTTTQKICGGKQGLLCASNEWCQWDVPGSCGVADQTGTCQPKPEGCPADCPGVCACDGSFFCNACGAHQAGWDTGDNFPGCGIVFDAGPPDDIKAFVLPTSAPRYMITKADHANNRCLQIVVSGNGPGVIPDIDVTMGWGVDTIAITPSAADCDGSAWPPPLDAFFTNMAKGSIKHNDVMWPCIVDVDVAIAFPQNGPPWVPSQESVQAFGLVIQGACIP